MYQLAKPTQLPLIQVVVIHIDTNTLETLVDLRPRESTLAKKRNALAIIIKHP
jgi:hypothetical protein